MRSEDELIIGLRKQIPGLFEEFVRRYQRRVYFTALRLVGERDDALDVAQEVFLKIWRFAPKMKKELSLEKWVYRITVNTCIDRLRQRKRTDNRMVPDNVILLNVTAKGMNPHEYTRMMEELQEVKAAMNELTERQRSIFVLRHFQNLKLQEIADILELPVGTIKATLHQTLFKLRGLLRVSESDSEKQKGAMQAGRESNNV